jgi:hypothetical protein
VPPWKLFNPALKKGGLMMPLKELKITLKRPYLKTTPMTGIVFFICRALLNGFRIPHVFPLFLYRRPVFGVAFMRNPITNLQKTALTLISGIDKMHWPCEYVTDSYT